MRLPVFSGLAKEERSGALTAFVVLFSVVSAHTLMETARDALFLARLDASRLAWVYLMTAALAFAAAPVGARLFGRRREALPLAALLLVSACVTLSFFWLSTFHSTQFLYALYVWSALFATLVIVQFWVVIGSAYTITQAKRVYGFIGAGSAAGAIAGAGLARYITHETTARHLLLASGGILALSAIATLAMPRAKGRISDELRYFRRRRHTVRQSGRLLRENGYVRGIFVVAMISAITFILVDFVFKNAVQEHVPPEKLGSFFATTNLVLNFSGLVAQLGIVGWLVRRAGVTRAASLLPALLFVGSLGAIALPSLAAMFFLKGPDGALRYSLHRTTLELLDVPISEPARSRTKEMVGGLAHRGGQALGSLLILAVLASARPEWLLAAIALLSAAWWIQAHYLRKHYLDLFRAKLKSGRVESGEAPVLDLRALETFIAALNSEEDSEVLAALDLLADQNRARLIPALILYHPSADVVLRALEIMSISDRRDFLPLTARLRHHSNPAIRAAVLAADKTVTDAALRSALRDPSPDVRAVALVHLVSRGRMNDDEVRTTVAEMTDGADVLTRRALVRAIRRKPDPVFRQTLIDFGRTTDRDLAVEIAQVMTEAPDVVFIPTLISMLGKRRSMGPARAALLAIGPAALEALDAALGDTSTPLAVRRHLPRTISRFDPTLAAPILMKHLASENDGMVRYKILRGLGRLRASAPDVVLDVDVLAGIGQQTAERLLRTRQWRLALEHGAEADPSRATAAHELLVSLLTDKERLALERLFRILGLRQQGEDFEAIHRGLTGADSKARSSSRELLEHLLKPPLREAVLQVIDERPKPPVGAEAATAQYEAAIEELLEGASESLRCLTAMHVGELGLTGFRQSLEVALPAGDGPSAELIARAIAMLEGIQEAPAHRG